MLGVLIPPVEAGPVLILVCEMIKEFYNDKQHHVNTQSQLYFMQSLLSMVHPTLHESPVLPCRCHGCQLL